MARLETTRLVTVMMPIPVTMPIPDQVPVTVLVPIQVSVAAHVLVTVPVLVQVSVTVPVSMHLPVTMPVPVEDDLGAAVSDALMVISHDDGPSPALVATTRNRGDQSGHANKNDSRLQHE